MRPRCFSPAFLSSSGTSSPLPGAVDAVLLGIDALGLLEHAPGQLLVLLGERGMRAVGVQAALAFILVPSIAMTAG